MAYIGLMNSRRIIWVEPLTGGQTISVQFAPAINTG